MPDYIYSIRSRKTALIAIENIEKLMLLSEPFMINLKEFKKRYVSMKTIHNKRMKMLNDFIELLPYRKMNSAGIHKNYEKYKLIFETSKTEMEAIMVQKQEFDLPFETIKELIRKIKGKKRISLLQKIKTGWKELRSNFIPEKNPLLNK